MIKNKQTNYTGVEENKIENTANHKLTDRTKDEPKARMWGIVLPKEFSINVPSGSGHYSLQ